VDEEIFAAQRLANDVDGQTEIATMLIDRLKWKSESLP
jgi:hypothetical protein